MSSPAGATCESVVYSDGTEPGKFDSPLETRKWTADVSKGILAYFEPDLKREETRVKELVRSQQVLLDTVQQGNTQIEEYTLSGHLDDVFRDLKTYHGKLVNMKKDMAMIDDKVARLRNKTSRLMLIKQKEDMYRAQQEDRKVALEREITAKPVIDE